MMSQAIILTSKMINFQLFQLHQIFCKNAIKAQASITYLVIFFAIWFPQALFLLFFFLQIPHYLKDNF